MNGVSPGTVSTSDSERAMPPWTASAEPCEPTIVAYALNEAERRVVVGVFWGLIKSGGVGIIRPEQRATVTIFS